MKKKNLVVLSLLLCFALLFTACGKKEEKPKVNEDKPSVETPVEDVKEEKETSKPAEKHSSTKPTLDSNKAKPAAKDTLKPHTKSEDQASEEDWNLYYVLKICFFSDYAYYGSDLWYGEFDDHDRIAAAYNILVIWEMMDYDTSEWDGNDLAQEMNNYYDQDKSLSIWDTACTVVGIDHSDLADFYMEMTALDTDAYYYYDVDGDVWFWDGSEDTYIGSGDTYYIGEDGECYEYADPVFYYDEEGDIWYGIGDDTDEFIGFGDEYYIDDYGDLCTYSEEDYGSDPFFWSDSEGNVWHWNGETDEFIGTAEEYYVDDDGRIFKVSAPVENKGPSKFYWADEDDDVWFWNGSENEFIGFSNECYVDNSGLHWYGGYSGDYGDYGDTYIWYDEDGDMWFFNGEYDEYWG